MSWWNNSWCYRQKLTFDNSGQSENLQDFPVLVALTTSNFDFNKAKDNGEDIRFVDSDDTTEVKYEIENWDKANSKAWIWVKVPQIDGSSSTDYIYMYYGNSGASDAQDAVNTWDSHYKAVYHLNKSSGDVLDSTGNNNDGTNHGATRGQTGKIDKAFSFGGEVDDDYIDCGAGASLGITGAITVEAWAKLSGLASTQRFVTRTGNSAGDYQFRLKVDKVHFMRWRGGGNTYDEWEAVSLTGVDGEWAYYAIVYDGSDATLFVNNSSESPTSTFTTYTTAEVNTYIGRGLTNYFDGLIDEVRISDIARSADWIKAQYLSMTLAFITFGGEYHIPLTSSDLGSGVENVPILLATSLASDIGSGLDAGGLFFTAGDVGSGLDAILVLKAILAGEETGSALEAAILLKAFASVDGGFGTDALVSLLARMTADEEGSSSDRLMVKIESGARGGVRLPPGAGATSIPSREVHL